MGTVEKFGETQDVAVTVLVDNTASWIAKSTDTVIRYGDKPLLAEHGFAALIDLRSARQRVLWDAGVTRTTLLENMQRMEIDPAKIDRIALSHGHPDHIAAMTDVLRVAAHKPEPRKWEKDASQEEIRNWVKGRRVPLVAHPAAFRERWSIGQDGVKYGPVHGPSRAEWEAAGAAIVLSESPYRLGPGCWTTGAVPRVGFEKAGTPPSWAYREGDDFVRDYVEDDQSIVLNVKGRGLVVVSGCAHAGILNTIHYAQEISGVERIWAIVGGFHLAPADDQEIQRTIDEIKRLKPQMVVPTHCTGFRATCQFAAQMPDEFVMGVVGTTYLF